MGVHARGLRDVWALWTESTSYGSARACVLFTWGRALASTPQHKTRHWGPRRVANASARPRRANASPRAPQPLLGGSRSDPFSRLSTRVRILFFIPAVRRMVVA